MNPKELESLQFTCFADFEKVQFLRFTCLTDFNTCDVIPDTKQKHDSHKTSCFDAHAEQIVRYFNIDYYKTCCQIYLTAKIKARWDPGARPTPGFEAPKLNIF